MRLVLSETELEVALPELDVLPPVLCDTEVIVLLLCGLVLGARLVDGTEGVPMPGLVL